ncbi:MAG: diguanylate cyclase [Planctomycetes bacterium]|nr:diguanylate cyclase [Planctomycetota bacterium]
MKVLIVDDSPDALAVARVRLASENAEIVCASSGQAALDLARREKPDLILLDIDMPDMSGFDVCRTLKEDAELNMAPVIFLSGSGQAGDKVRGLDLGAVDYVTKPFDTFELRARVRAALRTKRLQDMLIEHAHIDPLTGLSNRRAMMDRLEQEWARMGRHGGTLSFIMADIDHFKEVNDTFGHAVGDRLLRQLAKIIAGQCRDVDLPTRYGGDEFVIVAPQEEVANAGMLAERCRLAIEETPLATGHGTVGCTVSLGAADTTNAGSIEALIQKADDAMYQAKQSGRNKVVVASDSRRTTTATPG